MTRPTPRIFFIGLLTSLVACQGPTGVGTADARFNGTWRYVADVSGSPVQVQGQLRLDGADAGTISGTLDAQQVDAVGGRTSWPGLVTGSVLSNGTARLEISVSSGRIRTHLATLRGDSLVGDWVESGSTPAGGAFRAAREIP